MLAAPVPVVLAIAAHDPLGGAGLAADLTTFAAKGVHGTVAVTAVTAQHLGSVDRVEPMDAGLVADQIDAITDTFTVSAVKTGLLGSAAIVDLVAERVERGVLPAPVVDPVLVDGRGRRFVADEIEQAYRTRLMSVAAVVTPNLGEASLLAGCPLASVLEVDAVAEQLRRLGAGAVVVTGGSDQGDQAVDVVVHADGTIDHLESEWIATRHVRGSGCTFAAATAAGLALGLDEATAIGEAKVFVADRLRASTWSEPGGAGPVAHWFSG